jgi:hypothetical protein
MITRPVAVFVAAFFGKQPLLLLNFGGLDPSLLNHRVSLFRFLL